MDMNRIKIGVIDTDVNFLSEIFEDIPIYTSGCQHSNVYNSHGSAVCAQIVTICENVSLHIFPIFNDASSCVDESKLLNILNYIDENEDLDIINMSFGIVEPEYKEEIEIICNKISAKGTIIVSAFDNAGAMSYPACLPLVIGVSASEDIYPATAYQCIYGSEIDIMGSAALKKIKLGEQNLVVGGTSFVVPIITGLIAKIFTKIGKKLSFEEIKNKLEENALDKITYHNKVSFSKIPFKINKAIVLPANKENHALMHFCDTLPFEILDFYDFKYFFNIGKNISQVANLDTESHHVIKGIDSICWEDDFDTVIIGHLDKFNKKIGDQKIIDILDCCLKYNKNIFTYDSFLYNMYLKNNHKYGNLMCYYSCIDESMVPTGRYGKLWYIDKPVLSIMGTRTRLGKFTLQQIVKQRLLNLGYMVGYLSTEPSGELFGADEVFPYGYNSAVDITYDQYIPVINEMLHNISKKDCDFILTGSQSGTLPYDFNNMARIVFPQTIFLFGTAPDGVILCVSSDDEIEYIKRTIVFIESSCDTNVIALVVFPIKKEMGFVGQFKDKNISGTKEYKNIKDTLNKETGKDVFQFTDSEIDLCIGRIIDFFTEE